MSAGWLLLGLLALAFVGSGVARGRGVRGFGLPSGSEWLLSGIVFGKEVLGLVGPSDIRAFSPLVVAASGFVAFTIGQRFSALSRGDEKGSGKMRGGLLLLGVAGALLGAAIVSVAAYWLLGVHAGNSTLERVTVALYVGVMLAGSTRQLLDWARERQGSKGDVTDAIEAVVCGTELLALFGTAPLSCLLATPNAPWQTIVIWSLVPVAMGLVLGKLCVLLLHVEVRLAQTWGILLGMFLLATGISLRIGSSVMVTGYVFGWVVGQDRRSGAELRIMTQPTEGAVALPLLVIAGASVHLGGLGEQAVLVLGLIIVRFVSKLAVASFVRLSPRLRRVSVVSLSQVFGASGEITCLLALSFWLMVPDSTGQLVLATAVAVALLGELFGARGLRAALSGVNEMRGSGGPSGSAKPGNMT